MAKIKIGKQYDESLSKSYISTTGDSNTEITFDDIFDRSKRILHIEDEANREILFGEFEALKIALKEKGFDYENELKAVKNAENAIKQKDDNGMLAWLSKAGKKALDLSAQIGLSVISGLLTYALTKK